MVNKRLESRYHLTTFLVALLGFKLISLSAYVDAYEQARRHANE